MSNQWNPDAHNPDLHGVKMVETMEVETESGKVVSIAKADYDPKVHKLPKAKKAEAPAAGGAGSEKK